MAKILNDLIAGVFNIAKGTSYMLGDIEKFLIKSQVKNLFSVSDVDFKSSFTLGTDGNLYAGASYDTTGFMYIKNSTSIITSSVKGNNYIKAICFYDINRTHLTGTALQNQFFNIPLVVPATAYFCRISVWKESVASLFIEIGNVLHNNCVSEYSTEFGKDTINGNAIIENSSRVDTIQGFSRTVNLFNQYNVVKDTYILGSTGFEITTGATGYYASEFIPVLASTSYICTGIQTSNTNSFYDSNKKYISGGINTSVAFTTPALTAFMRISINPTQDISSVQLEQNTVATKYVPYVEIGSVLMNRILRKGFQGKTCEFLGDSITSTGYYIDTLISLLKIKGTKLGISGTCLAGTDANAMWKDVRINAISAASDIVFVYGGHNDMATSFALGTVDSTDTNTVAGAVNTIITKLKRKLSGMTCVFTVSITGTNGTAVIKAGKGLSSTFTFTTDLSTSCANFVTANTTNYLAQGITLTSNGAELIMSAGYTIDTPYFTNSTGDVASTIAAPTIVNIYTKSTRIIFLTPTYLERINWAASGWSNSYTNTLSLQISDYSDIIKTVCNRRGIEVIDTNKCGINSENLRKYIANDGALVHHNTLGGEIVANYIIDNLIQYI